MKGCKHQNDSFEAALDQIEQMIECLETDKPIRVSEITGSIKPDVRSDEIRKATCMLLKKYGITYSGD